MFKLKILKKDDIKPISDYSVAQYIKAESRRYRAKKDTKRVGLGTKLRGIIS